MQTSTVTLRVLNPRAKVESITQVSSSPRLGNLAGKKIGILNNTKPGGEMLLPYIEEALKKQIPDVELRTWKIPFAQSPDDKEPKLKELAQYADAIIALTGD